MIEPADCVFSFQEGDHLTRIHLKLALEDIGFRVCEHDETILLGAEPSQDSGREDRR